MSSYRGNKHSLEKLIEAIGESLYKFFCVINKPVSFPDQAIKIKSLNIERA